MERTPPDPEPRCGLVGLAFLLWAVALVTLAAALGLLDLHRD